MTEKRICSLVIFLTVKGFMRHRWVKCFLPTLRDEVAFNGKMLFLHFLAAKEVAYGFFAKLTDDLAI